MDSNNIQGDVEAKLKQYYKNLNAIGKLKYRLEVLNKQAYKIKADIENSNILFESEIRGINYTSEKIQCQTTGSQQEKAIEEAFKILEKQYNQVMFEICRIENEILQLEYNNSDMEYIINNLDDKHRSFIEARYKKSKSVTAISQEMYLSRTTVYDLRKEIFKAIEMFYA